MHINYWRTYSVKTLKELKTCRNTYLGLHLSIFVKHFEIYLVTYSLFTKDVAKYFAVYII
jgi:hypothetical protein